MNEDKKLIKEFITTFATWFHKDFSEKDVAKYLDENFTINNNGKIAAKGIKEYFQRIQFLKRKYQHVEMQHISFPMESGGKYLVHYSPLFTDAKKAKTQVHVYAIVSLKNGKIALWDEVAAKAESDWDR